MNTSLFKASDTSQLADHLVKKLPEFSKQLIDPAQTEFLARPDDAYEHFPRWHEFGIVTHTAQVLKAFREEVSAVLSLWKLDRVQLKLKTSEIDGISKWNLFELSIPLHDIGKFERKVWRRANNVRALDFSGHENASERIVLTVSEVRASLEGFGLLPSHIQYIARLCGLHFELGKARNDSRNAGNYSIAFARSASARQSYHKIAESAAPYAAEVGLYFLVDSMGKLSVRPTFESDEALEAGRDTIRMQLAGTGQEQLLEAALQFAVNFEVARQYLETL